MSRTTHESRDHRHGNVFGRGSGSMFIHVQRENGLAHRTLTLRPWQVQALRLVTSRWFALVLTLVALSWGYFAIQTARVPFLTKRIAHLESDAAKIDTLQATLGQLQKRYEQVQQMLSAAPTRTTAPAKGMSETTGATKVPAPVTPPPEKPAKTSPAGKVLPSAAADTSKKKAAAAKAPNDTTH